jgi:hypothetical protein
MNPTNDSFPFFQKRYKHAYSASKITSFLSYLIQIGAVILAAMLVGAGLFAASRMSGPTGMPSEFSFVVAAIGCASGVVVGSLFYILGILVASQAQLTLASIDAAVNSAPFLTDDQKLSIINGRSHRQ